MDRRTLLALLLTAAVIVMTPILFPAPPRRPADTTALATDSVASPGQLPPAIAAPTKTPTQGPTPPTQVRPGTQAGPVARVDTTTVTTQHAVYRFSSLGATPVQLAMPQYRSLRRGGPANTPANLIEPGDRLFRISLVTATDTVALDSVRFTAAPQRLEGETIVQSFTATLAGAPLSLTYRFPRDSFVVRLDGSAGTPLRQLHLTLPTRIRSEEADVPDDTRHLAVAYRTGADEIENARFDDLDTIPRIESVKADWIAERNKYFVVAYVPVRPDSAFGLISMRAAPEVNGLTTTAHTTAVMPLSSSNFALRIYAGPQSWEHLRRMGPELENVNPYGGFMHGMVQPFTTIVMRMILWMRNTFGVSYGWVLVIFGVMVRIVLWPLNQNAMRSSMKLQRIQPQLQELQGKYKDNPEKQRDAMMKLYQEHGMSPFTPILGCLPMLIPMPILFALYFVFQNTIELRGVPFLWLPDLSLKDPYYITPLLMGVSMYVMTWIGMKGMPPNPQSKMMLYVMPIMFTVLFWNFASGLNLYYAVQNVAALPQQWLLSRERTKPGAVAASAAKPVKVAKKE
jgi:YidC/Oxa1 family membrane protein insertase